MKKLKLTKVIASTLIAFSVIALNPIGASAEWKSDNNGWWYTEGNSYAKSWRKIDGKWYYFNSNGYMLKNITSSGYTFGNDGSLLNTRTQYQNISMVYPSTWIKGSSNGKDVYYLDYQGTNVMLSAASMQGKSAADYMKDQESKVKSECGLDKLDTGDVVFNNNNARVTHYYVKSNDKILSAFHVTFFNNDTAYHFTLIERDTISQEHLHAFENMLHTVEFIN